MDGNDDSGIPNITYGNVALAFACFILFDTSISTFWGLGVGSAIITAAVRCVMQLSLVALLWKQVFEANNPWLVAAIACASLSLQTLAFKLIYHSTIIRLIEHHGDNGDWYVVRIHERLLLIPIYLCGSHQQIQATIQPHGSCYNLRKC